MNTRINELIIRQLGDGIYFTGWYCQNCDKPREGIEVTYHEHCAICKTKLLEMEVVSKQETEKRELLEIALRHTIAKWYEIKANEQFYNVELSTKAQKEFVFDVKTLEKSLSMKWSDIVIFLEGEG